MKVTTSCSTSALGWIWVLAATVASQTAPNITLLKELNSLIPTIDHAIQTGIPNPINVDAKASGSADAGCIIPAPFHKCICHASASYEVDITKVSGANKLTIENFTHAEVTPINLTTYNITVDGKMAVGGMSANGGVHAGVDACGIKPSASGSASCDVGASGSAQVQALASLNSTGNCLDVKVHGASVHINSVSISNIHVDIDLAGIHLDVSKIVDLINGLSGDIGSEVEKVMNQLIPKLLPDLLSHSLPCVPIKLASLLR